MRILYYTHTAFFEVALSLVAELSRLAEVHLVLEMSPTAWGQGAFDVPPRTVPSGLVPADPLLATSFPAGVRDRWRAAASFRLVVHPTRRSLHPTSWRIGRQVIEEARRLRADAFHLDDVDVSPRMPLAVRPLGGMPLVLSVHDADPHSGEANWRKTLARRVAYPAASRFILHNRHDGERFRLRVGAAPEAVHVAHLGPYEILRAWLDDPPEPDPRTVAFLGRLSPYKGLETLYAAAPLIARRVPDVRIVVAGRAVGGYRPPVPPRLDPPATIDASDRYLPTAEMARLLAGAALVVCPYRDATQSGVVLAAYGLGRPVVATRVGGLPEYVDHGRTGLLVPPDDPVRLADAVVEVLTTDGLLGRLETGVREMARGDRSWSAAAAGLLDLYRGVAG